MSKLSKWKNREKSLGIPKLDSAIDKVASVGQERLFFLQQIQGDSLFYQYGHLYEFSSAINKADIESRFDKVVEAFDILRSNYLLENNVVKVNIRPKEDFKLDTSNSSQEEFFQKTFDLQSDLLIRAKIIDNNKLALSIHHIIADRQSLVFLNHLLFDDMPLTTSNISYFDFAHWQKGNINKETDLKYWNEKLSNDLPALRLPLDRDRSLNPSYIGKTIEKTLSRDQHKSFQALCIEQDVTNYVLLLAVFKILLHKYSGQKDIIVGTPVSNRDRKELEQMIGFFNETIVLKSSINPKESFESFLSNLKSEFLDSLAHKNVSFGSIVKSVNPARVPGVNPIFQTMFLFNRHADSLAYQGNQVKEHIVDLGVSKFDMTLFANEHQDVLQLRLEYSSELFDEGSASAMFDDYVKLLESVSYDVHQAIGRISLYENFESNTVELDAHDVQENSVLELIPFKSSEIAVVSPVGKLTYKELEEKSNNLAAELIHRGLQKNQFVGLYTKRSIEMITGIVSILKAGGAYLPLDPEYPAERIDYMIMDSKCDLILSTPDLIQDNHNFIDITMPYQRTEKFTIDQIKRSQLAYAIYTSGSSGKPKGVPINHGNLLYSTSARFKFYDEQPGTFMLLSSFSFDSSVAGIFWTLCSGGTLLLPPEKIEQDIEEFANAIDKHRVTHTLMLPSLYQLLLDYSSAKSLRSLKNVMVAGEACSSNVVSKHFATLPHCKLYNEYGPTEATVWCIAHEIQATDKAVPIGGAIPYYDAYILDSQMQIVPPRVIGDLYIGGPGLSEGYLYNDELSKEKFFKHPKWGRIYRTGDLAKRSLSGEIYFLGRADSQVKIRGHRVELDEIKNRILERSKASEVEVIYKNNKLIAYSNIGFEGALDLPDYMIPSRFVTLEQFPKLPNGKTDLKQLPDPITLTPTTNFKEIRTPLEDSLVAIWEEVLGSKAISIHDNFFDLGGDSLLSIQMVAKARKEGIQVFASALFANQTIRKLALHIEQSTLVESSSIIVPLKKEGGKKPLFCIHGGGAHVFFYKSFAERLKSDTPVYSFQPEGLDGKTKMVGNIQEMSSKYIEEMKKVQPSGPYQILGTCFSNAVALEMANQLTENGDEIENLFIIDSAPVHLFGNNEKAKNQTIQRFLDMLRRGDFSRIKSKISRRIFGEKEWNSPIKDATDSDEVLKNTIFSLNKMYADYSWKPFAGKIRFIRSSEFNDRKDKNYHLIQWNKLAKEGLDVKVVEGHHLTLFEEPEVDGLAKQINELISSN